MKRKILTFSLIALLGTLYSCGPVYKCGEEKPERGIQGSNRLLAVVEERDELCDILENREEEYAFLNEKFQKSMHEKDSINDLKNELVLKNDTLKNELNELGDKYSGLQGDYQDLSDKYSTAITEKLNQGHLYDERIKEKERRLGIEQEKLAQSLKDLEEREKRIQELEAEIAKQDSIAQRLNNLIKEALLGFDSDELTTSIKDGKVYVSMSDKLMFKSGKIEVEAKGKEALKALASVLQKNKDFQIAIEGHTDNVPIKTSRFTDNWDLSVGRATSVVRILQMDYDIVPERLTASGKGEFEPRASNDTKEGRAQNRRTDIILSPNLSEIMNLIQE